MPYVLISHGVEDYDEWKPGFDAAGAPRAAAGSQGGQLFHAEGDENEIFALAEFDSLEDARALVSSEEFRGAMEEAGVTTEPEVSYLESIEEFPE